VIRPPLFKNPYLVSLAAALVFLAVLEVLFSRPYFLIWVLGGIIHTAYFYFRYKKLRIIMLPVLFWLGIWGGMTFFLSFGFWMRQFLIGVLAILYFLIHFNFRVFHQSDLFRKDLFYLLNFFTLLLWAHALFVLLDFDLIPYMVILLLAVLGGAFTGANLFYLYKREQMVLLFVFGLISLELFWLISFWPFFYLTSAAVFVILYYSLWRLEVHFLENRLNTRVLLSAVSFALILIGILFILTPWFPV